MRKATVTYSFRENDTVPMIRLRGKWLSLAGFEEGTQIEVKVGHGSLTLIAKEAGKGERASHKRLRAWHA